MDSGDVNNEDEWSKQYQANDTDFDDYFFILMIKISMKVLMPLINLFLDNEFWVNLVDMTNLHAHQMKEAKPNHYFKRISRKT